MIKAVFLVLALAIVVTAIVVLANFANKSTKRPKPKKDLDYDEIAGVYYDSGNVKRVEKNGVISYTSKKK